MIVERCPNCGALLTYDKNKFAYVCRFCGHEFASEETHMMELCAEEARRESGELEDQIREEEAAQNLIDNLETSIFAANRLKKIFKALFIVFTVLAVMPAIFFICGIIVSGDPNASEIVANIVAGFAFGEILFIPATVTFLILMIKCKRKLSKLYYQLSLVQDIHAM